MKIREVIDRVLAYHPPFPAEYDGCDGFKCGDPEAECTGIAVSLVPTVDAIRRADVLIVAGTSLTVYPAAAFLDEYRGNRLVLINKTPTPRDDIADLALHEKLGEVFSRLA